MMIRSKNVFIGGKLQPATIVVSGGTIQAIRSYAYGRKGGIDAGQSWILPGAIDGHVHVRDPEAKQKEDFSTASAAALAGGVTSIIDMPCYKNPPTVTVSAASEKLRIASSTCRCDFGFHFGGTNHNASLAAKISPPSIKIFLCDTNSPLTVSMVGVERHFHAFPKENPVLVHCEDAAMIGQRSRKFTKREIARSEAVALSAVKKVAKLGKKYNRRVHFVHLTSSSEVTSAKCWDGATVEVAAHHLFMDQSHIKTLGPLSNVNPPLRKKSTVAGLWKSLAKVDCYVTDHAPHLVSEKEAGAAGYPGLQTGIPLLLDAVLRKKLSLSRAMKIACENPAKAFLIKKKGKIEAGFDADFFVFDPKASWNIREDDLHSKCGWSPYTGWKLKGKILAVFLRGQEAVSDNEIEAAPGFGRELDRRDHSKLADSAKFNGYFGRHRF